MRRQLLLILPLAGILALGVSLLRRGGADSKCSPTGKPKAVQPAVRPAPVRPPPIVITPPASKEVIAMATYEARVQTTIDNFRTAFVTQNVLLQDALRPVLLKDRDTAIRIARRHLETTTADGDRTVARGILDILERAR